VNSAKKCGSFGFGRTLQVPPGPLPRSNGIMFQDQGSKRSISHAKSPAHNANAQMHLNITKRNLICYSNRTYLGLSKHGKAYVAQPRRAHIPKSLLELAGPVQPHRCSLHQKKATQGDMHNTYTKKLEQTWHIIFMQRKCPKEYAHRSHNQPPEDTSVHQGRKRSPLASSSLRRRSGNRRQSPSKSYSAFMWRTHFSARWLHCSTDSFQGSTNGHLCPVYKTHENFSEKSSHINAGTSTHAACVLRWHRVAEPKRTVHWRNDGWDC